MGTSQRRKNVSRALVVPDVAVLSTNAYVSNNPSAHRDSLGHQPSSNADASNSFGRVCYPLYSSLDDSSSSL